MTYRLKGRVTSITPERADRMVTIINALRHKNLSIVGIGTCAHLSSSGARKYIKDLTQNGIISPDGFMLGKTGRCITRPLYALTKDADLLEWFLVAIKAPAADGFPRCRGQKAASCMHVMQDDEVFMVKRALIKPPKQFDLVLYLFGLAPAEGLLS